MNKKINDFVVFCMEIYKAEKNISGKEVYELFEKYGVLKYLQDGYDMLHTQGDSWLISDIDKFLEVRGYKD